MKKISVLGAGMVGSAIVLDLCNEYEITAVDYDEKSLEKLKTKSQVNTITADLKDPNNVKKCIAEADLVIGAVPGFMGYETLKTVINCGKNIVDISFFPEAPFALDELAKSKNVTAVVDCGVAPGMSNIFLGYHNEKMKVDFYECLVGGLPVKRTWPYQYKAPFSPIDVIEEYVRPAMFVENGIVVTREALSDPEYEQFHPIGTLEAFNTDGLRTLIKTMKVPYMKEKTMRYPGHIEYMHVLRESGFFDKKPVEINGQEIRPLDMTAKLLFPRWKFDEDEADITVMRIILRGEEAGVKKEYVYSLFDHYDTDTKISSMARTTGFTCSAGARLVMNGTFSRKGICPPEYLGASEDCFNQILLDLKKRNIN